MTATQEAFAVLLALQSVAVNELSRALPPGEALLVRERLYIRLAEMAAAVRLQPEADELVAAGLARLLDAIDPEASNLPDLRSMQPA